MLWYVKKVNKNVYIQIDLYYKIAYQKFRIIVK